MSASPEFGGIDEDELRAFMATDPQFRDANVSLAARFARAVAGLVIRRAAAQERFETAVLILSESLANDTDGRSVEHAPMLAGGNDPIGFRIWLTQAELKNAYALAVPIRSAADAFRRVAEAGLDQRPAVLVDGRGEDSQARLYPKGTAAAELWTPIDLSEGPIPPDRLQGVIDRFWYQGLRTPEMARQHPVKIWKSARRGTPFAGPERRIQARLRDVLFGAFPRHTIRAEVPTEEGRADIFVVSKTVAGSGAPAQMTDWALELKALADRTTGGNVVDESVTRDALKKGVGQARHYRNTQNGVQAAVCCFDMRNTTETDQALFAHVASIAQADQIFLWRWLLYRSANDARMAS